MDCCRKFPARLRNLPAVFDPGDLPARHRSPLSERHGVSAASATQRRSGILRVGFNATVHTMESADAGRHLLDAREALAWDGLERRGSIRCQVL